MHLVDRGPAMSVFEELGELNVIEVGYADRPSEPRSLDTLHGRPRLADIRVPHFRIIEEVQVNI